MPKSDLELRVRHVVEDFVRKITDIVNQQVVRAVQDTLSAKTTRAVSGRSTEDARPRRGRPPSPEIAMMSERIANFVQSKPGLRLEEIARDMGVESKLLKYPISKLLDAGVLRTEGQARGTRYFPAGSTGRRKKAARKKTSRKKVAAKAAPRRKKASSRKKTAARKKTTSKKRR